MNPLENLLIEHQHKLRWVILTSAVLLKAPAAEQLLAWIDLITT